MGRDRGEKVEHHIVVDLDVAHTDGYCLVKARGDFVIDLGDSSWNNTSVFVLSAAARHGKCFASTSLPVTHYGPIVALNYR